MRTVILYGSPHGRRGDTAALVETFCAQAGGEFYGIDAYHADIRPCVDCRACWRTDGCAIADGMTEVYRRIAVSDVVVIASPIYFSLLTGPLLSVGSRLQAFYAAARFRNVHLAGKPKVGVALLTGGGDGSSERALAAARCLIRQMGADYIGCAASLHTDTTPARDDREALAAAAALARQAKDWAARQPDERL